MVQQNVDVNVQVRNKKRIDELNTSLGKSERALGGLGTAAKVAAGALAALGTGAAIKSFVDVGRSVENLQLRFKFLFGSATEGAKAFETLSEFASTVPFSLDQIAAASGNLAVVSEDAAALGDNLKLAGNIAAVTGLDFQTAGEQLQRALSGGIGAADLLREKGVNALLGFKQGAAVTVEETAEAFNRVFGPGGEFGNAAESLAQTFDGVVSMLGDKVFNFQRIVGEEFVNELTKQFGSLDQFLAENQQTIDEYARAIGIGLAQAVEASGNAIKFIRENADLLALAFQVFISLKVASTFIKIGRSLVPVVASMRALVSLSGVGLPLVAASVAAAAATFIALDKAIDGAEKKMSNLIETGKDRELAKAVGAIEDAMIIDVPGSENSKQIQKREQELQELLKKEKKFIEQMEQLGEDELQKSLRKEEERIERLKTLREKDVENYQVYSDLITKVEEEGAKERAKIYEAERKKRAKDVEDTIKAIQEGRIKDVDLTGKTEEEKKKIIFGASESILDNLAKVNKKAFQLQKAYALATAIANTALGVTQALKNYPPPISFVLAGAQLAAGLAQVASIRSTSYTGRQRGGPVVPGSEYIVGEAGPEMFVPNTPGRIVNNQQMGSGQPVNVTFNINTVDAQGFDNLIRARQGTIIGVINQAMNERGRRALT